MSMILRYYEHAKLFDFAIYTHKVLILGIDNVMELTEV